MATMKILGVNPGEVAKVRIAFRTGPLVVARAFSFPKGRSKDTWRVYVERLGVCMGPQYKTAKLAATAARKSLRKWGAKMFGKPAEWYKTAKAEKLSGWIKRKLGDHWTIIER